jgi:hypothetical protein
MDNMNFIRVSLCRIMAVFLPFGVAAQGGLHITPGGKMVTVGTANLVLNSTSFVNDGNFAPGNSTVAFTGFSLAAFPTGIGGTVASSFNKIVINKDFGDVVLGNDVKINSAITMNGGNLRLNNHTVDLGATGSILGENNVSHITGTTGGSVLATRAFFTAAPLNPGNIGLEILAAGPAGTVGTFTVERKHLSETLNSNGVQSIQRSFTITGTPKAALDLRLRFFYQDSDIFDANENSMIIWTPSDIGNQFVQVGKDSNNAVSNWVVKNGITQLGHYVLANPDNGGGTSTGIKPKKVDGSSLALADDGSTAKIKVYPNPTQDQFTIELFSKEAKLVLMGLYDQSGRLLQQREIYCVAGRNSIRWDLGKFVAGTYYLSAAGLGLKNSKIVKVL